jgi:hypothetical protein
VIVVMSHGDNGKLYAKDREYSTAMLWKYFNAKSCPSLAGKPKLFFVQVSAGLKYYFIVGKTGVSGLQRHESAPGARSPLQFWGGGRWRCSE